MPLMIIKPLPSSVAPYLHRYSVGTLFNFAHDPPGYQLIIEQDTRYHYIASYEKKYFLEIKENTPK